MTDLCVPIFVHSPEQAKRDIATAAEAGADIVELRLDDISEMSAQIRAIVLDSILPCIATCRPEWEGGHSTLSAEDRLKLLDELAIGSARFADVELKTLSAQPTMGLNLIVSAHDFTGRPARLSNILLEMNEGPGTVNKIVWMARTLRDNLEAFELLQQRQKPTIALCMGEAGMISRVLAKKFGAFLTFASLRDESATAPGQVTIHDMKRLYRWDAINAATKVYGVVASPVMHSMSPAIHNAGFEAVGHDGVYLPLLVNPGYESFKAFMESFLAFAPLDLSGLSITLPHKENALRYLKEKKAEIEPLAERIGTINTIVIDRSPSSATTGANPTPSPASVGEEPIPPSPSSVGEERISPSPGSAGEDRISLSPVSVGEEQISPAPGTPGEGRGGGLRLRGFNTDYAAILDTITTALGIAREQLSGRRVAVIGAGGTGRTAVAALAECGATVVVYNRTFERAEALAKEFNGRRGKVVATRMEKLRDSCCEIYINATSLGLHPNSDAGPFDPAPPKLTSDSLVFDTIYNPIETKLLKQAKAAGAKAVGGVEMFVRQAAGQFQAWTGKPAPMDLFRKVIESRLEK